jgi:ankyrin repeat protein
MKTAGGLVICLAASFLPGCILLTGEVYDPVPDPLANRFVKATAVDGRTVTLADGRQIQLAGVDARGLDDEQRSALAAELSKLVVGNKDLLVMDEKGGVATVAISGGHMGMPWREFPVLILFPTHVKFPPMRRDAGFELIQQGLAPVLDAEVSDPARLALYHLAQKTAQGRRIGVWKTAAERLCDAAGKGDLAKVRALATEVGGVNTQGYTGDERTTPLIVAATAGRDEVVQYLLASGADKDARDGRRYPALNYAAYLGHAKVVSLLIAAGADVNARRSNSPLEEAVSGGHIEAARLLLEAGAKTDYAGADSALWHAARDGKLEIVKLLVEHGAKVDEADREGKRPLQAAAGNGHAQVVEYLLSKGADVNARDNSSYTPLKIARQNYHADVVKILEKAGARD